MKHLPRERCARLKYMSWELLFQFLIFFKVYQTERLAPKFTNKSSEFWY